MSKLIRQGEANLVSFGQSGGAATVVDAAVVIPSGKVIVAIQSLSDSTVFSTMTSEGGEYPELGATVVLPTGVTLFGRWTALTASAGEAVVYFS